MQDAKIQLSPSELELAGNAAVLLTKNRILQKTKALLEQTAQRMQAAQPLYSTLNDVFDVPPKVSRGENYQGLPYLILDYPRCFTGGNVFAIRSFFWWGHFFSSTLQLSGAYKQRFLPQVLAAQAGCAKRGYYLGVHPNPWQHHFEPDNYQPAAALALPGWEQACRQHPHIKIAAKWPVQEWPFAATHLLNSWMYLLTILAPQAPPRR